MRGRAGARRNHSSRTFLAPPGARVGRMDGGNDSGARAALSPLATSASGSRRSVRPDPEARGRGLRRSRLPTTRSLDEDTSLGRRTDTGGRLGKLGEVANGSVAQSRGPRSATNPILSSAEPFSHISRRGQAFSGEPGASLPRLPVQQRQRDRAEEPAAASPYLAKRSYASEANGLSHSVEGIPRASSRSRPRLTRRGVTRGEGRSSTKSSESDLSNSRVGFGIRRTTSGKRPFPSGAAAPVRGREPPLHHASRSKSQGPGRGNMFQLSSWASSPSPSRQGSRTPTPSRTPTRSGPGSRSRSRPPSEADEIQEDVAMGLEVESETPIPSTTSGGNLMLSPLQTSSGNGRISGGPLRASGTNSPLPSRARRGRARGRGGAHPASWSRSRVRSPVAAPSPAVAMNGHPRPALAAPQRGGFGASLGGPFRDVARAEAASARVSLPEHDRREATIADPATTRVHEVVGMSLRGHNPMLRKTNQDAMVMVEHAPTKSLLLACFDGHGVQGHDVSGFIARNFVALVLRDPRLIEPPSSDEPDIAGALSDALRKAEELLLEEGSIDASLSGSTAVAAVIRNDLLWAVGIGDSRVVLGRCHAQETGPRSVRAHRFAGRFVAEEVTVDHKPDLPAERARIVAAGGRVMATRNRLAPSIIGPARVWLKDVPAPGLAMSRSIGDLVAKAAGVVSTADKFTLNLQDTADCLVLASDGIWDFVTNEEVVHIVGTAESARHAATVLTRLARGRWLERTGGSDDITVVVARLQTPL